MGKKKPRLMYVEWDDHSAGDNRWQDMDKVEAKPLRCKSVGWVAKETKDAMTLVATVSEYDHTCGDMTILKNCIKKKRLL